MPLSSIFEKMIVPWEHTFDEVEFIRDIYAIDDYNTKDNNKQD